MKKFLFTYLFVTMALTSIGQFIPQPLNYPGTGYWPYFYSIVDPDHVWIGTIMEDGSGYSSAVKTIDGGNSWLFCPIPVPGVPWCSSLCAWDTNICYFVFVNNGIPFGSSIWKTTDGGTTWTNMTTDQFAGGYANFFHAFSADTGMAMGDPTSGYFEIQLTNDGGNTWSRVPSANIPVPLSGEYGLSDDYSAVGNTVWFVTNKGRCFKSTDRGQTWNVTQVVTGPDWDNLICFASQQNGVFWKGGTTELFVTTDGGDVWDAAPFPSGYSLIHICPVKGFDGGFIITAFTNFITVFFTPDMFTTLIKLDSNLLSNGSVSFFDATTGWLAGGESGTDEIYKFNGVLTSVREVVNDPGKLSVVPNPSSGEALLILPGSLDSKSIQLRIIDMTGKAVEQRTIVSSAGWVSLKSAGYSNGIYIIELLKENRIFARERWIVKH